MMTAFLTAVLTFVPVFVGVDDDALTKRFHEHIKYLADDKLEGRGVGTPGIDQAAGYIAKYFADSKLTPAGDNNTYFQTLSMTLHRTLTDQGNFAFSGGDAPRKLGVDYTPLSYSSNDKFDGDVVFCGYGIINPDKQHDDFAGINLTDKVAVILAGEPASWADANGFPTKHAMPRNKVYNAKDRNALAVIIVNQTPAEGTQDRLPEFVTEDPDEYGLPVMHVLRSIVDERFKTFAFDTLAVLQEKLDAGKFVTGQVPHLRATGFAGFEKKSAPTRNVIGMLKGDGPLADECVVIGAHYDHLGLRRPMSRTFKAGKIVEDTSGPQIHNGADDNASGVGGLIEIARLFSESKERPRRSVLFIAFTAEESGLHGSKHYMTIPSVPIDKTVAMLNMDMIGRLEPGKNSVEVFGLATSPDFESVVTQAANGLGLTIAPGVDEGGRSDHAPFVRANVPSMHFFSGQHPDYHKPSDDSDKINAKDGARITRLVFEVAKSLATRDGRPTFRVVESAKKQDPGPLPSYRVVMGLAPSYTDDGKPGMGVDGVNPDGPADLAGMKPKDRIINIGGKKIANIYDYMASTRNNKPGDEVEVVVLRDDKEITLKVTLAGAK